MYFLGLLPMIDPPRFDTALTIQRLVEAGVEVKMITGDHLNIAKETARLVGMATNILPGEMTREADGRGRWALRAHPQRDHLTAPPTPSIRHRARMLGLPFPATGRPSKASPF